MICVSVLREVPNAFSELPYRRLYLVHEMVQFARYLIACVVRDDGLPCRYDVQSWIELSLENLRLDPGKREMFRDIFQEHRVLYDSVQEFERALERVEEVVLSLALNCLDLPGVTDLLGIAVSPFCPVQLAYGDEQILCERVQHLLDILLVHGHVSLNEQISMLSSFRIMMSDYREGYLDDGPVRATEAVSTLFQLASGSESGKKMLRLVLCLCGAGTLSGTVLEVSGSMVSVEYAESVCRVVYSWCVANSVRHIASLPDGMIDEVKEVLVELPVVAGNVKESMWSRVGRVGDADYRRDIYARLGLCLPPKTE